MGEQGGVAGAGVDVAGVDMAVITASGVIMVDGVDAGIVSGVVVAAAGVVVAGVGEHDVDEEEEQAVAALFTSPLWNNSPSHVRSEVKENISPEVFKWI